MRLLVCLTILLLSLLPAAACAEAPEGVTMLCLNVGKADCILLKLEGRAYLVDTGYKRTSDSMLRMLEREGVTQLDGVFLTHDHKDHYGGLKALSESSVTIDAFYTAAYCLDGIDAKHPAVAAAARRGQTVQLLSGGDKVEISETAYFEVLGPLRQNKDNENNNSLVMRLVTPDGSILLTGDMKHEEEYELLSKDLLQPAEVLKVAFHGDNTSTSSAFLKAVKPQVGVICTSTAEEKDTPSKETLYRLASVGCRTYVTQDAVSAIRVVLKDRQSSVDMEDWSAE